MPKLVIALYDEDMDKLNRNEPIILKVDNHNGCDFCNGISCIDVSADGMCCSCTIKSFYNEIDYCPLCGKKL